jgi:hypothetical protein
MGLDKVIKLNIRFIAFVLILLFFSYADASINRQYNGKILTIKTTKKTSLSELITSSGYDIADRDVTSFLEDFVSLNRDIKNLSIIPKGTIVRLPLKTLKPKVRKVTQKAIPQQKVENLRFRKEPPKEPLPGYQPEQEAILKNIKILLHSLNNSAFIRSEGIKVFSINDKSELSFNTSFFPLIEFMDNRTIMLDYQGILPEEIKDIVEISWPEYKVVSNHGRKDIKNITGLLLDSLGYSSFRDGKVILGGKARIEFFADLVIVKKSDDILEGELIAISIIKPEEYRTPDELKEWAEDRGVRMVELSLREPPLSHSRTEIVYMSEREVDRFSERFLNLLGYEFSRDVNLRLSDRKEYEFNIKADLTITLGNRTKVIDFSEFYEQTISYAKARGFDIVSISSGETRSEILRKIIGLLSINCKDRPETTSSYITPKGVKYRLLVPGTLIRARNGMLFLTDPDIDTGFLSHLVADNITLIKF